MKLQIYGTGCAKCKRLYQVTDQAAQELDLDYDLEKVEDIDAIVAAGVLRTPALGVEGHLVLSGRVPSVEQVKGMLREGAV